MKTTLREKDALLPDELLTEDEAMRAVEAADSLRDKAFVITLYESVVRIVELSSMRIRDVAFEEGYVALMLKGKTRSGRVVVVAATLTFKLGYKTIQCEARFDGGCRQRQQ